MKEENNYQRSDAIAKKLQAVKAVEGLTNTLDFSVAIVVGRWHTEIVDKLLVSALDTLQECGIQNNQITVVYAPGAYEIPLVTKKLAQTQNYQAIVTLGAVIRGDTPHFDYVAGECVRGISDVSLEYDIPIAFGVLTVDNLEQAQVRSRDDDTNKGREATLAALEMVDLLGKL